MSLKLFLVAVASAMAFTSMAASFTKERFAYTRTDGRSLMYQVSNVSMTWIDSAKVASPFKPLIYFIDKVLNK